MTTKAKLIRTVYLYLASLISLIFVAVGTGRILNTALKAYVFPKAEKGGFSRCNQQPPVYNIGLDAKSVASEDQKAQLDQMIKDYERWKNENSGEECYITERQTNYVDSLTMLLVSLPIFLFHWKIIKKEKNESND